MISSCLEITKFRRFTQSLFYRFRGICAHLHISKAGESAHSYKVDLKWHANLRRQLLLAVKRFASVYLWYHTTTEKKVFWDPLWLGLCPSDYKDLRNINQIMVKRKVRDPLLVLFVSVTLNSSLPVCLSAYPWVIDWIFCRSSVQKSRSIFLVFMLSEKFQNLLTSSYHYVLVSRHCPSIRVGVFVYHSLPPCSHPFPLLACLCRTFQRWSGRCGNSSVICILDVFCGCVSLWCQSHIIHV